MGKIRVNISNKASDFLAMYPHAFITYSQLNKIEEWLPGMTFEAKYESANKPPLENLSYKQI